MPDVATLEPSTAEQMTAVRLVGRVNWVCPHCKDVNITKVKGDTMALRCAACRHVFLFGLRLIRSPRGRHHRYHLQEQLEEMPLHLLGESVPTVTSV